LFSLPSLFLVNILITFTHPRTLISHPSGRPAISAVSGHSNALQSRWSSAAKGIDSREWLQQARRPQPARRPRVNARLASLSPTSPACPLSLTLLSHSLSLRTPLRLEPACQCLFSFAGSQQFCSLSFAQILFLTVGPLHCRPASYRPRLKHHRSCLPSLPACFAPKTESDTTAFPWHHSDCQAPTLSSALHHHHPCAAHKSPSHHLASTYLAQVSDSL
jgi:hypothetical protein